MGLTDTPGGAAMAGYYAFVFGLGFATGAPAMTKDEYKAGREKAFNSLVGKVMAASKGKANPAQVNAILKKKLG